MNQESTRDQDRRRGNRGRGRGGRRDDQRDDRRSYNNNQRQERTFQSEPKEQPKPTLLQRIIGFFTGGKKAGNQPRSERPARSERPERRSDENRAPRAERSERPERRPLEKIAVTTPKVYVGNLSYEASESDLFELFNGIGAVRNAEIVSHRDTQRSKGFAFVTMSTVEEAQRAVDELHDKEYMGRKMVVTGSKSTGPVNSDRRDNAESSSDQSAS